ncbi:MAG: hypothetical protein IPL83_16325 [Bdellovibrionales bacterium]|nr:hypothetical protein [Bdellovibrionales bacterium]
MYFRNRVLLNRRGSYDQGALLRCNNSFSSVVHWCLGGHDEVGQDLNCLRTFTFWTALAIDLYVDIEVPFHEMGDASKRLATARAIIFKKDLADLWKTGKCRKNLQDLMDSAIGLGDVHCDKIYPKTEGCYGG